MLLFYSSSFVFPFPITYSFLLTMLQTNCMHGSTSTPPPHRVDTPANHLHKTMKATPSHPPSLRQPLHSPLRQPQCPQQSRLNKPPPNMTKHLQPTAHIMPDIVRRNQHRREGEYLQELRDTVFEEPLGRVLDVPVAPFGEHAAEGIVNLGVAVSL